MTKAGNMKPLGNPQIRSKPSFRQPTAKTRPDFEKRPGVRSVDAYPANGNGSAPFLWSETPELFEGPGFERVAPPGKDSWIYSLRLG